MLCAAGKENSIQSTENSNPLQPPTRVCDCEPAPRLKHPAAKWISSGCVLLIGTRLKVDSSNFIYSYWCCWFLCLLVDRCFTHPTKPTSTLPTWKYVCSQKPICLYQVCFPGRAKTFHQFWGKSARQFCRNPSKRGEINNKTTNEKINRYHHVLGGCNYSSGFATAC